MEKVSFENMARHLQVLAESMAVLGHDAHAAELHALARRVARDADREKRIAYRCFYCAWCVGVTRANPPADGCKMTAGHVREDGTPYVEQPPALRDIYGAALDFAEHHYGLPWYERSWRDSGRSAIIVRTRRPDAPVPAEWLGFPVELAPQAAP